MILSNVMASSLDGLIAAYQGENEQDREAYGFGSEEDRAWVRSHLSAADAVIVGAETMRAAGKIWAVKNTQKQFPEWLILTRNGLDATLPFWTQHSVRRTLVSPEPIHHSSWPDQTVRNLIYSGHPASFLYNYCKQQKYQNVVLFGGGVTNRLFYEQGLVSQLHLTLAPVIIARHEGLRLVTPELPTPARLRLTYSSSVNNHVFLSYQIEG
ncbi:MAG: dihydrofolate reductase family protein [Deltaproteobacteria bacterium]|nr:dihydrofolate reductase family protein [Deltaproteobacteria bacterium]